MGIIYIEYNRLEYRKKNKKRKKCYVLLQKIRGLTVLYMFINKKFLIYG